MKTLFKNTSKQKLQQSRDKFYLINILVCPKCGEPVFGDATGHKCGDFQRMLNELKMRIHTHPGVWEHEYQRMLDVLHEARKIVGDPNITREKEIKVEMEISKRLAEDVRLTMEKLHDLNDESQLKSKLATGMPDSGGKTPKSVDAEEEGIEESVQGCHIEGKIEFGENAPEELKKKSQEVEKMRETINKLEAKQKAKEIRKLFEDDLRGPRKLA